MNRKTALLMLVPALTFLGACGAGPATHEAGGAPPTAGTSPAPTAGPTAGTSPAGTESPAVSPAGTSSQSSPASAPRCHTADLRLTMGPTNGAAGTDYSYIVFKNVSAHTCTMTGYPGVSWVAGPDGPQVNDPLARRTDSTPATLVLGPQSTAQAVTAMGPPGMYGPACHATHAAGYRVYPPDETEAVFVPYPGEVCSAKGVGYDAVGPIGPRTAN